MRGNYILAENGDPIACSDTGVWGRWFVTADRTVARTERGEGVRSLWTVSTVFLGIDHNFGPTGDPVLWETLIFGGEHDGEGARYTSLAAARAGHEIWVLVAEGKTTPDAVREMEEGLNG